MARPAGLLFRSGTLTLYLVLSKLFSGVARVVLAATVAVTGVVTAGASPAEAAIVHRTPGTDEFGAPVLGVGPQQDSMIRASLVPNANGLVPPGVNDWSCRSDHDPVVLIPGTIGSAYTSWSFVGPQLAAAGYCAYAFNHNAVTFAPVFSFSGDITESAEMLAVFVDHVLAETGRKKVTLLGQSQGGGLLPIYYMNFLGGAAKVSGLVGLTPTNHGTTFPLPVPPPQQLLDAEMVLLTPVNGQSLAQQATGSPLNDQIYNHGPVTRPGIRYTMIVTNSDTLVTPYTNGFIWEPGVDNILIQDRFPGKVVSHVDTMYDEQVFSLLLEALNAITPTR